MTDNELIKRVAHAKLGEQIELNPYKTLNELKDEAISALARKVIELEKRISGQG